MNPILFNTEMVRATLDDRKTVTRRVVKPQPRNIVADEKKREPLSFLADLEWVKPPYQPGDILYVRETWAKLETVYGVPYYAYKADDETLYHSSGENFEGWHPSIHMPREAARIFLRVTDVRVQKLKDITDADALREGFYSRASLVTELLKMYPDCTADSWFWVVQFERISREEAMQHAI